MTNNFAVVTVIEFFRSDGDGYQNVFGGYGDKRKFELSHIAVTHAENQSRSIMVIEYFFSGGGDDYKPFFDLGGKIDYFMY